MQSDWCSNLLVCLFACLLSGGWWWVFACFEERIIIVFWCGNGELQTGVMDNKASPMTYDIVNEWKFNLKHADRKGTASTGGWRLKEQGLLSLVVMLGS